MSLFFKRSDVLCGPNLLIDWKLLFRIPLIGVFDYSLYINSHLLDKFLSFWGYRYNVQRDSLEYIEESRPLSLV